MGHPTHQKCFAGGGNRFSNRWPDHAECSIELHSSTNIYKIIITKKKKKRFSFPAFESYQFSTTSTLKSKWSTTYVFKLLLFLTETFVGENDILGLKFAFDIKRLFNVMSTRFFFFFKVKEYQKILKYILRQIQLQNIL